MLETNRVLKLILLAVGVILVAIVTLVLSQRPRPLSHGWIEAGAILLLLVTTCVGLWARDQKRLSVVLVLLLAGNILGSAAVLLPLDVEVRTWVSDAAVSLYVLSFLARIARRVTLVSRKG
jgi:hypothetical protein